MNKEVLRFDNVSYTYPGGIEALGGISFAIAEGERVALLGLNGSGKSTLLLTAAALLFPDSGTVAIGGARLTKDSASECRKNIGMVFQNSDDQLFMSTVEADVAFGPRNMKLDEAEIARRVDEALALTGCTALRGRSPWSLSGGQKKMVSIATVLSMSPGILVLDEPTSGLDYAAQRTFSEIASSLPQAMLMATHDLDIARGLCSRAIILDKGLVVYDGDISSAPYPPKQQS